MFLPSGWAADPARCQKAGIPLEERVHRTKPALALKPVKEAMEAGIDFDFIAGDGLYGHNGELTGSLDELGQFYVLDIHKDELVFLREPVLSVPVRVSGKGRKDGKKKRYML